MTKEKWHALPKRQQIQNIASELTRAYHWLEKSRHKEAQTSLDRSFELIDLTVQDGKWRHNAKRELLRLREMLGEWYGENPPAVSLFVLLLRALVQFDKESASVQVF